MKNHYVPNINQKKFNKEENKIYYPREDIRVVSESTHHAKVKREMSTTPSPSTSSYTSTTSKTTITTTTDKSTPTTTAKSTNTTTAKSTTNNTAKSTTTTTKSNTNNTAKSTIKNTAKTTTTNTAKPTTTTILGSTTEVFPITLSMTTEIPIPEFDPDEHGRQEMKACIIISYITIVLVAVGILYCIVLIFLLNIN